MTLGANDPARTIPEQFIPFRGAPGKKGFPIFEEGEIWSYGPPCPFEASDAGRESPAPLALVPLRLV